MIFGDPAEDLMIFSKILNVYIRYNLVNQLLRDSSSSMFRVNGYSGLYLAAPNNARCCVCCGGRAMHAHGCVAARGACMIGETRCFNAIFKTLHSRFMIVNEMVRL
jgi:hypothetical protein